MNPYVKQYQKNQIETASPEKILIMLYDGAIQYLNIAKATINEPRSSENIQKIHNNIVGAQKIITEFMNTLDMDIGGEIASNLMELYNYLYNRLVEANVKKDIAMIDEVLNHLKGLKETWLKAIEISKNDKSNIKHIDDAEEEEEEDFYEKAGTDSL